MTTTPDATEPAPASPPDLSALIQAGRSLRAVLDGIDVLASAAEMWRARAEKAEAALAPQPGPQPEPAHVTDYYDVVFDGPPGNESGRFVELEDGHGEGISAGRWLSPAESRTGHWILRLPRYTGDLQPLVDEQAKLIGQLTSQREEAMKVVAGLRLDNATLANDAVKVTRARDAAVAAVAVSAADSKFYAQKYSDEHYKNAALEVRLEKEVKANDVLRKEAESLSTGGISLTHERNEKLRKEVVALEQDKADLRAQADRVRADLAKEIAAHLETKDDLRKTDKVYDDAADALIAAVRRAKIEAPDFITMTTASKLLSDRLDRYAADEAALKAEIVETKADLAAAVGSAQVDIKDLQDASVDTLVDAERALKALQSDIGHAWVILEAAEPNIRGRHATLADAVSEIIAGRLMNAERALKHERESHLETRSQVNSLERACTATWVAMEGMGVTSIAMSNAVLEVVGRLKNAEAALKRESGLLASVRQVAEDRRIEVARLSREINTFGITSGTAGGGGGRNSGGGGSVAWTTAGASGGASVSNWTPAVTADDVRSIIREELDRVHSTEFMKERLQALESAGGITSARQVFREEIARYVDLKALGFSGSGLVALVLDPER